MVHAFCVVSHSCMVALRCDGNRSRSRVAETSSRGAQSTDGRLTDAGSTVGQSVSKPRPEDMRVEKPEPYALDKDFDDWDFTFNGYAGTLDLAFSALLKTARQSPTVVMATPPHEQQSATLLYFITMLTQKGARKAGKLETTVSKLADN